MSRRVLFNAGWLLTAFCAGCVERQYTILTNPPGAVVLENGKPVGAAPLDRPFRYYGTHRFTILRDGYQTQVVDEPIRAPWYEYFPLDFVAENLIPWTIRDHREFKYILEPVQVVPPEVLLQRSQEIRIEGHALGTTPGQPVAPLPPNLAGLGLPPSAVPAPGAISSPALQPPAQPVPQVQPLPAAGGRPQPVAAPVQASSQPAPVWTPGPR